MNKPTWNYILNDLALYSLFTRVAYSEDVPKQDKVDLEHQIKLLQQENRQLKANRYEVIKKKLEEVREKRYMLLDEVKELLSILGRGKNENSIEKRN